MILTATECSFTEKRSEKKSGKDETNPDASCCICLGHQDSHTDLERSCENGIQPSKMKNPPA